jgi:hypothetical protein
MTALDMTGGECAHAGHVSHVVAHVATTAYRAATGRLWRAVAHVATGAMLPQRQIRMKSNGSFPAGLRLDGRENAGGTKLSLFRQISCSDDA